MHSHRVPSEDAAWGPPLPSNSAMESQLLAREIAKERQEHAQAATHREP